MYQICLSWLYTWIYILIFGRIEIVKDDKKRMKGVSHFFFGQGGGGVYHIELVKFMTAKYHSWNNTSLDAWSITLFK